MEVANPNLRSASFKNYIHLVWISCVYTLLVFACWFAVDPLSTLGPIFSTIAYAASIAAGLLVAVWSVFGPGNLIVRGLIAHAIAAPVIIANAYGSWVAYEQIAFFGDIGFSATIQIELLTAFAVSVALQVPFWFIRFLRGWRLSVHGHDSASSVPLSELFVLTLMFGLAFAAPQIADRVKIKSLLNQLEIGNDFQEIEQTTPNSWTGSNVTVTTDNVQQLKSSVNAESHYHTSPTIYRISIAAMVVALLLSPIFLIMFRVNNWRLAILYAMLNGLGVYATTMALMLVLTSGTPFNMLQAAWDLGLSIGIIVLGFSLPLSFSRGRGFILLSSRSRKKQTEPNRKLDGISN